MNINFMIVHLSIVHVITLLGVSTEAHSFVQKETNVVSYTVDDIIQSLNNTGIDYSILLNEFNKICPSLLSQCTTCSRDPWCWQLQSCCPDVPYAFFKVGCVNLAITKTSRYSKMIDGCPIHLDEDDERNVLCGSNSSETAPVTYGDLDFKNKHCAECHGVNVYEPWDMVFNCKHAIPDDLKIDDMFEESLSNLGCVAEFTHPRYSSRRITCKDPTAGEKIGLCNLTGLWEEFDQALKWACETLDNLSYFGIFKNVYCYLCNPSIASTATWQPIKQCNYSDMICKSKSFASRLSPYGNGCFMFCYGLGHGIKTLDVTSHDTVRVTTRDNLNRQTGKSQVDIQLRVAYTSDILGAFKTLLSDVYGDDFFIKQDILRHRFGARNQGMNTSLRKLLRAYTAICGDTLVCDKSLMEHNGGGDGDGVGDGYTYFSDAVDNATGVPVIVQEIKSYRVTCNNDHKCKEAVLHPIYVPVDNNPVCGTYCSCCHNCLQGSTCCVDLLLQDEPFSCYSENDSLTIYPIEGIYSSSEIERTRSNSGMFDYSLVSGCLHAASSFLTKMCTGTGNYVDSLSYIPVESENVHYRNIYCLLCNKEQHIRTSIVSIELECDSYLETDLFPDLRSMLQVARNHCKTKFIPKGANRCRNTYKAERTGDFYTRETNTSFKLSDVQVISKCNETGFWSENNIHIRRICEGESESILRLPEYRIDYKVYKNFACFECNPVITTYEIDGSDVIKNCTGMQRVESVLLSKLCSQRPFHERWFPYKNFFCAQCNQPPLTLLKVSVDNINMSFGSDYVEKGGASYTYRDLFRLAPVSQRSTHADESTCAGIYDTEQRKCREFQCGQGRILANNTCQQIKPVASLIGVGHAPTLQMIQVNYLMIIRIRPEWTDTVGETITVLLETLCNDFLSNMFGSISLKIMDVLHDCTVYNASCDTANITLGRLSSVVVSYTIDVLDSDLEYVEQSLVDGLSASYDIETTSGNKVSLRASPISQTYVLNSNISRCTYQQIFRTGDILIYVDKFLNCPQLYFNETDVDLDLDSDSITLRHYGTTFSADDFKQVGNTFIICKEDFNRSKVWETVPVQRSAYYKAYIIFFNACVILSLVCLLLTFITFAIFKTLRSIPGKNIMTLTLTLFLAQLQVQIAPFVRTGTLTCEILGISLHYFWLSTFCAMCACSLHMFNLFYIGFMTPHNQHMVNNYIVAKYNAFVFGLPLGVISVFIAFNMVTTSGEFSGYGADNTCFLTELYPVLLAFVLPSLLLTVTSITLFSMSFHRIRTAPRMRCKQDRNDVIIYIKLCTIVGITWPLQVVDGMLELSFLSFIAVGLNGLQGVFIFVAYICNAKIRGLYKDLIFRNPLFASSVPSGSSQTTRDIP